MTETIFAVCRPKNDLVVKRIPLNAEVQADIGQIFRAQEASFRTGIDEYIPYDGNYKPSFDELLTLEGNQELDFLLEQMTRNRVALEILDVNQVRQQKVKAICSVFENDGQSVLLIQKFKQNQILSTRRALFKHGNEFRRLSGDVIGIADSLCAIYEGRVLKFRSASVLRSVVTMKQIYMEATEPEVRNFARLDIFLIENEDEFVSNTNQITRSLLHSITQKRVLDDCDINRIVEIGGLLNLAVETRNGRLVVPRDKRELKAFLQLLNENRYSGLITEKLYVSNSQREIPI